VDSLPCSGANCRPSGAEHPIAGPAGTGSFPRWWPEGGNPSTITGMSDQPSGESAQAAGNGASSPPYPPPRPMRRLFDRWFFSTERRYAMFQTIVGGTIANLLAAGIIAAIAIAAGAIHVSFRWSWATFLTIVGVLAVIVLGGAVVSVTVAVSDRRQGKSAQSTGEILQTALWGFVGLMVISTLAAVILASVDISIGHKGPAFPPVPIFSFSPGGTAPPVPSFSLSILPSAGASFSPFSPAVSPPAPTPSP